MLARRSWLRVVFDTLTFHQMPIRKKFTLFTMGVSLWYCVIGAVGVFRQPDWHGVITIAISLVIAHVLLIAFAWNAARSMTVPLEAINSQVREITSGELTNLAHIDVSSRDEVGELTMRFNGLLDALRELATFKKVIELDDTADEVYGRLRKVFRDNGLKDHHLLVIDGERRGLRVLHDDGERPCSCADAVGDFAAHCRAFKSATVVTSDDFQGVCRHFSEEGRGHQCVPIILGGAAGGVAQFVYPTPVTPDRAEIRARLDTARRFLDEALPVLEMRRLTDTLRENALRDGLTGLFNRRYLEESHGSLTALVKRRGARLGVVMCDVDHFKRVNDQHGHAAGDLVLKDVAATLSSAARASDVVVRYGGEEFLLLLHDADKGGAARVAERMRAALQAREITVGASSLRVTMSLGVAEYPTDGESFWEVVRLADESLYRAKSEGRNRVVQHHTNPPPPPPPPPPEQETRDEPPLA